MALFPYYYYSTGTAPSGGTFGSTFGTVVAAKSPTAWWRLGESAGTTATDEQGVANGTYTGSPTLGATGYASDDTAATFAAASSQYVDIPDAAEWDFGTSDASVMIAIKLASWPAASQVILSRGSGDTSTNWKVYLNHTVENRIGWRFSFTWWDLDATTSLADGEWHLLGFSLDRDGLMTMTVDGASEDTVDISSESATAMNAADKLGIAAQMDATPTAFFDGSVDEVAWWNGTLLSTAEWAAIHAARAGTGGGTETQADTYAAAIMALAPVAYYKMGEGSGSTMVDSSTTGKDGVYQNGPTLSVAGPFTGASGVTFDGSTQWAQAGYDAALDMGTADWSAVMWIKRSAAWDTTNELWLMARGSDNWDGYELVTHTTANIIEARFGNVGETGSMWARSAATSTLYSGDWEMIGISADRDGLATFWHDGVAYGTADISGYQHESSGSYALYLARRAAGGYWAGSMCQVAIFDSLLDSTDIAGLWTAAGN